MRCNSKNKTTKLVGRVIDAPVENNLCILEPVVRTVTQRNTNNLLGSELFNMTGIKQVVG